MQKTLLIGYLGKDPERKYTPGGTPSPPSPSPAPNAIAVSGGIIPPHNTVGAEHFAFAVSRDELKTWRVLLQKRGIEIESEVR